MESKVKEEQLGRQLTATQHHRHSENENKSVGDINQKLFKSMCNTVISNSGNSSQVRLPYIVHQKISNLFQYI